MRIVIAEDQGMVRGAIGKLLSLEPDIELVGEAENGEEALQPHKTEVTRHRHPGY